MLGGCIFSIRYTMLAKVYKKIKTVGNSGQIKYSWVVDTTIGNQGVIPCIITPFKSNSFSRQGIGQVFAESFLSFDYLKMQSEYNIPASYQITEIKSVNDGSLIYKEMDIAGNPQTWYNTSGSSPVIDPFGAITEYNTLLARAEQQGGNV